MKTKFTKDYQITSKDLAEAECLTEIDSLKFNNTFSRYYNIIILSIMLSALLVAVYRIFDPVFLVNNEEYIQSYSDRIQEAIWNLILLVFILCILYPQYNPLIRLRGSKKHKQNFLCRETKSISITKKIIAIKSANFRESRQWNTFDKVLENKHIFLLLHSRKLESIVVPKRIFDNETELDTFRKLAGITKS